MTLHGIVIVVKNGTQFCPNAVVMLMSDKYVYSAKTSKFGVAVFPHVADENYTCYVAKKDMEQERIDDIKFDMLNKAIQIQYAEQEKTEWDGMYANTSPQLYVNDYDGGRAELEE